MQKDLQFTFFWIQYGRYVNQGSDVLVDREGGVSTTPTKQGV